jgi:RluA family pseudouridine synthase
MNSALFKVLNLKKPTRVFDYIVENTSQVLPSKSAIKKAFKKKHILINGLVATTGDWLKVGDNVSYNPGEIQLQKVFPLDLEILFEDEFIAVINKPAGYSVSGNFHKTIQNALSHNLRSSTKIDALSIFRPVHRLDKLTTGILLIAKTKSAQISLGKQFELQEIPKTYYALVKGKLEGEGFFDLPIEGLSSFTEFKSLKIEKSLSYDFVSLVVLKPKTGRTHQLRIHLAQAGFPIIGDYVHDTKNVLKGKGLFLAACKLSFTHPDTSEFMTFEIPIPSKYDSLFERELRRWEKFKT